MARSINDFKSSFKGDIARPSRFDVSIPVPVTLLPYLKTSRSLEYRCENANLPGRTLGTVNSNTYGPAEKFPYMNSYNDIDLTFIVDDSMNQKVFFDGWLNFINPLYNNNYRYKSDYCTDLQITQYDVSNKPSYSVTLYEAFPVSINQMDLDWSNEGYHKVTVTFAYTYWKNNSLEAFAMELLDAAIGDITDRIGGLGGTTSGAVGAITGAATGAVSQGVSSAANYASSIFKK